MDYSNIRTAPAEPLASAMIETFRAIGYSLETAVADIIDNSISAGAKNIWIDRIWDGGRSVITIKDDGRGMNDEEIQHALRPGYQNPNDERDIRDLGRFGLGLKTASFSQCRKVSVLSKRKGGNPEYWSWDLDYVAETNKWNLIHWLPVGYENTLDGLDSGTLVIWSDLDRVVSPDTITGDESSHEKFSGDLDKVKRHLEMTFHRFLEDGDFKLWWCGNPVRPWDPFCTGETCTQPFPDDHIQGGITVKGFVLPHQKSFSSEQAYKSAEGIQGWSAQQGFYVYRGKRLLLAGNWLKLFKKEEPYKLVRIRIDIPNTQDKNWKIDIKKSQAYPPAKCREQLFSYAQRVRNTGLEVYKHRGRVIRERSGTDWQPLWLERRKDNQWFFEINRDNELVKSLKEMARANPDKAFNLLLKLIEESIPVSSIYARESSSEEPMKEPFVGIDRENLMPVAKTIYQNYVAGGMTADSAKELLLSQEPFNLYEDIIDAL